MAAKKQAPGSKAAPGMVQDVEHAAIIQKVEQEVKPLQQFLTKWNNDWTMSFATGLAYNLLMSLFPILLVAVANLLASSSMASVRQPIGRWSTSPSMRYPVPRALAPCWKRPSTR